MFFLEPKGRGEEVKDLSRYFPLSAALKINALARVQDLDVKSLSFHPINVRGGRAQRGVHTLTVGGIELGVGRQRADPLWVFQR